MASTAIWDEIERFEEQRLLTTGSLHGHSQERVLVEQFLQRVPMQGLFGALQEASDSGDKKKVKTVCACIDRVLSSDANDGMFYQPEMLPFLVTGLTHHEKAARLLTVNQLIGHLKTNPSEDQAHVLLHASLLDAICATIADPEVDVAAKAVSMLDMLSDANGSLFYEGPLNALLATTADDAADQRSVEFMRYLEAIARISRKSDRHMGYSVSSGAIDVILKCLKSTDTLFVMNVLDLMPHLFETPTGINHIFESGILQTLLTMSQDPLIGDSALRLVGEISATAARLKVESWTWTDPMLSKAFLSTIETKIQSDELQQIAAMDAIAAFASSSAKELNLLLQHKHLCKLLLQLGASTKMPLKANCFHAIARILAASTILTRPSAEVEMENASVWALNEKLFRSLGEACRQPTSVTQLMVCLRQPFEEIRIAVYTLLQAVAAQNNDWGVRSLMAYGGFFEYLLDRSTEPTKETREWKFAVVDALAASLFLGHLDAGIHDKLKEFLRQGPYVGKAQTELALDAA